MPAIEVPVVSDPRLRDPQPVPSPPVPVVPTPSAPQPPPSIPDESRHLVTNDLYIDPAACVGMWWADSHDLRPGGTSVPGFEIWWTAVIRGDGIDFFVCLVERKANCPVNRTG